MSEIKYKQIPFSLEKANIKGNKVVLRGDHSFEPEWYYFKTAKSNFPIIAIKNNGSIYSYSFNGYALNNEEISDIDLVILELIKEVKRTAVMEYITYKDIRFKLLRDNDVIDSMTDLYEITYVNDVVTKIEKV